MILKNGKLMIESFIILLVFPSLFFCLSFLCRIFFILFLPSSFFFIIHYEGWNWLHSMTWKSFLTFSNNLFMFRQSSFGGQGRKMKNFWWKWEFKLNYDHGTLGNSAHFRSSSISSPSPSYFLLLHFSHSKKD